MNRPSADVLARPPAKVAARAPEPAPRGQEAPRGHEGAVQTVGFALVENFSMIAFASALEPLRLANRVSGTDLYAWTLYSRDGRPVTASNGIAIGVGAGFAGLSARAEAKGGPSSAGQAHGLARGQSHGHAHGQVFVCGGVDIERLDHALLSGQLRKLSARGTVIGALCTGTHVLAAAGLLKGHRCTIHWENLDALRERFPDLDVTQELFEFDRNRITCAGGTASIDMMLSFIARESGPEIAALVTDELIHHRMREAGERQRMELRTRLGVAHPKLLAVIDRMEKSLEHPLACSRLAKEAKLSARQLERLFQKYIGASPTRYYLRLRLARARTLLLQTSMPILSVGLACGFISASHFSKCYSEFFRRTPSHERRKG